MTAPSDLNAVGESVLYLRLPDGRNVKRTTYPNGNTTEVTLLKGDVRIARDPETGDPLEKLPDGSAVGVYRPGPVTRPYRS